MDVPDKTKIIGDTLLWSSDIEQSFFQTADWLDLCGRNGVIGNPAKFVFAKDDTDFASFQVGITPVAPCESFMEAIRNFPTPKNTTDIRSLFGLINQVSYAFASAEKMLPFQDFLKPNTKFIWTDEMQSLFEEAKTVIINEVKHGIEIFDKAKPTCLATDWSKDGTVKCRYNACRYTADSVITLVCLGPHFFFVVHSTGNLQQQWIPTALIASAARLR